VKKLALMLALLLASAAAYGQAVTEPKCWPDTSLPISVERLQSPTTIGYGEIVYSASPIGLVWGWTCKASDGLYYKNIAAGPWSSFPVDWLYVADTLLRGTDADRVAAWRKYATATAWDTRLKTDIDAVWALLPNAPAAPPPPPPVVWKVMADPFRADKSRLVYTVVAGKRGPAATPTQYVPAGTPCDPVTLITELGPAYFASVLGNPNLIARCTK
jgi:hypothetical protein